MKTEDKFTPERDFQEKAWAQLADLTAMMAALFGGPESLAARKVLLAKVRQKILRWLAPLEALARRLLLLDATKLPLPNVKASMPSAPIVSAMRDGAASSTLSDNPADWRVIFNVCPGGAGSRQNGEAAFAHTTAGEDAGGPNHNALPLARRMEALLRVVRDRTACVKRMARLLAARRQDVRTAFAPYRPRTSITGPVDCLLDQVQRRVDFALSDTS